MALLPQIQYYNDGKTVYATYAINEKGHREGAYKEFTADGQLIKVLPYKDGALHGVATVYYLNGKVLSRTTFKNGARNGRHETFHQNGRLHVRCHYSDNYLLNGPYEEYTESARLIRRGDYVYNRFIDSVQKNKKWLRATLLEYNTRTPYKIAKNYLELTHFCGFMCDYKIKTR